ncbi:MAG: manganese efflux pump [Bacteroidia bacterium]|nr:manganese efflux pump [Bacteroidia bacterium]
MEFITIILIALSLSVDSFAVTVSTGISGGKVATINALKIAFSLAFFQSLLTFLGWIAGYEVLELVKSIGHWIAFVLLSFIGAKMIYESFSKKKKKSFAPLDIRILLTISFATSIDALFTGMSFGLINTAFPTVLFASCIIGIITFIVAISGIFFAKIAGTLLGKKIEVFGGIVLIGIGLKILLT